jgi:hypothetical protein
MIVLHTGPHSPRLLAEIIGKYAAIPVSYGTQLEEALPAHGTLENAQATAAHESPRT